MPLPNQIPIRYTEEDAGFVSVRPVVKQTFQLHELVDMVVSVAGKDAARVQQIFRTGTVVYNGYRYWWDALQADREEIERLLIPFPDDDPSRQFEPEKATAVLLDIGGGAQRTVVEISRQDAAQKKLFAKHSPWDVLTAFASGKTARYEKYAHARRADLFRISLAFDQAQPDLAGSQNAAQQGLCIVAVPPGPEGERFRALVRHALPEVPMLAAASTDDIVFYREGVQIPLENLEQVGAIAREAYTQLLRRQHFTPHSRADIVFKSE